MNNSNSPEELQKRVTVRIESLIRQENAGNLDKTLLEFWEWRLMEIWREKEADFDRLHKIKIAQIFEALAKQ